MTDQEAEETRLCELEAEQRRDDAVQRLREGFTAMDSRIIASLKDDQLAIFQAEYSASSPQFIRAVQEWQRRLIVKQVRGAYWAAGIGLVGTLLGVLLGWLMAR